jgi:hypothetical protein
MIGVGDRCRLYPGVGWLVAMVVRPADGPAKGRFAALSEAGVAQQPTPRDRRASRFSASSWVFRLLLHALPTTMIVVRAEDGQVFRVR